MTDHIQPASGYEIKAQTAAANADGFDAVFAKAQVDALADRVDSLTHSVTQLHRRAETKARLDQRPLLAGTKQTAQKSEQSAAFTDRYLRKGLEMGLGGYQAKSLNITTPSDGGYFVPDELDQKIEKRLIDISPIRTLASIVNVSSAHYRKLVSTTGFASGWVSETAGRPQTTTPNFAEITPPSGELYANPAATQAMLDDAAFDVDAWLSQEIALEFSKQEGAAFINGDGVNKPKGFLTYPTATTADGVRAFGTLQYLATGVAGGFSASNPADKLIDLVHALRPAYRQGAAFVMNSATMARIRKLKDLEGNFLWRPSLVEGQPATLLGYPVIEAEDMPDVGTDSLSIAFGNFTHGYVIAERMGTRLLRDPFSNKPFVHFYATRRVGGAVINSEAIKLMKFGVS